ncbi:hypothetical protein [Haloarcula sp. Atlit-120R]|uniref:hypothetical protein n=1 Tax=Haloarcula sp. Atlit-120R TaxID=2282135 RepID=UPI000EF24B5A|nr:hypothetical protein [Haloarcula sp. Atlit-120R]RLM39272.1 hypothetical protein DVK01_01550 [Haloarcula sp. Atlit-120R]
MASNETTVSGDVLYQNGDDLSEANLTRSAARSNATDYVERGLSVVVDAAAGTIDIDSGHCIVQDGIHAYDVFPNQVTDISLPAPNGMNHVYLVIDEAVDDDIAYHVDDDDTPPANPSLKIATADGGAGTATPLNPDPAAAFNQAALADRAAQPSGVSDKRVLYVDESDGNVYKVNPDGTEEQLGGGGIFEDTDDDDIYEQTAGQGIDTPSISTGALSNTESTILINSSIETYPATANGIESAVTDATEGYRLLLPGGSYNFDTTTLDIPRRGTVSGTAGGRGTRLVWEEGAGVGIQADASVLIENVTLTGPGTSTNTDIGIKGDTGDGQSRFRWVNFDGWAKNVYLDNYFNSVWHGCLFGGATGDASGFSEAASVHVDVASGANNNTRFFGCFWANNQIGPSLTIEGNEVQVIGYQGEANEAGEIKVVFGGGHQIMGVRVQNLKGGDGIIIDDGPTMVCATDMEASGSGQNGINFRNVSGGDAKTAGPHFFSGFGNDFNGVGTTGSVEQRTS